LGRIGLCVACYLLSPLSCPRLTFYHGLFFFCSFTLVDAPCFAQHVLRGSPTFYLASLLSSSSPPISSPAAKLPTSYSAFLFACGRGWSSQHPPKSRQQKSLQQLDVLQFCRPPFSIVSFLFNTRTLPEIFFLKPYTGPYRQLYCLIAYF